MTSIAVSNVARTATVVVLLFLAFAAGWAVRETQTAPLPRLLGMAVNQLHRGSVQAQRQYQERQADLHQKQLQAQKAEQKASQAIRQIQKQSAQLQADLTRAVQTSRQDVAVAEAAPLPPPVEERFPVQDPQLEPCLQQVQLATRWQNVAQLRQTALVSTIHARDKALQANKVLTRQIVAEKQYSDTLLQQRNILEERFQIADKRVKKLSKGQVKWWVATAAGVAAGIYLGGR